MSAISSYIIQSLSWKILLGYRVTASLIDFGYHNLEFSNYMEKTENVDF